MGDLTTGYTWVSGEQVTHAKLNQAINDAVVAASFVTGKSPASAISASADVIPLYSSADAGLRKATLNDAFFNHSALLTDRGSIATPAKEDVLFLKDADGGSPGYGKATLQSAVFESNELISNRSSSSTPAADDELLVQATGGGVFRKVTRTNFLGYQWPACLSFNNAALTPHTAPIAADHLLVWDSTASANKKLTLDKLVSGLPAGATPADAHLVPVHDGSSVLGKVTLAALKSYCNPSPATKAAVTGSIPAAAGTVSIAHGLSGAPQVVRVVLRCTDAGGDAGYAQNDEIELSSVTGYDYGNLFSIMVTATDIVFRRTSDSNIYVIHKTTGVFNTALTASKWQIKVYCVYFA